MCKVFGGMQHHRIAQVSFLAPKSADVKYMPSSVTGQDEPNTTLWLASPSGQDGAILPPWDNSLYPAGNISLKAIW